MTEAELRDASAAARVVADELLPVVLQTDGDTGAYAAHGRCHAATAVGYAARVSLFGPTRAVAVSACPA